MSKALWFSVAILLCSALAAEALTCNKCKELKSRFGCIDKEISLPCTAKPGQKCKVVKSFLGTIRGISTQGCTESVDECDMHVFSEEVGSIETTCCDERNLCNIP